MAVDCDAARTAVQVSCAYASGASFSARVRVTDAPAGGYIAFQTKLAWTDANLQYLPTISPNDEKAGVWGGWPDCTMALRAAVQPGNPSLLFACVKWQFPLPTTGSTFTGDVLQFKFQCRADGLSPLDLVPGVSSGTEFIGPGPTEVVPAAADASVQCGDPDPNPDPSLDPNPPTVTGSEPLSPADDEHPLITGTEPLPSVSILTRSARMTGAGVVALKVRCVRRSYDSGDPRACDGAVSLSAGALSSTEGGAGAPRIGRRSFSIPVFATKWVRVTLTRKGQRMVRRRKLLKVRASATADGGIGDVARTITIVAP